MPWKGCWRCLQSCWLGWYLAVTPPMGCTSTSLQTWERASRICSKCQQCHLGGFGWVPYPGAAALVGDREMALLLQGVWGVLVPLWSQRAGTTPGISLGFPGCSPSPIPSPKHLIPLVPQHSSLSAALAPASPRFSLENIGTWTSPSPRTSPLLSIC